MSKTKNIVIGILVCLLIIAISFITYDKFIAKNDRDCKCKECEKSTSKDDEVDYEKLESESFYNNLLNTFLKHFSYEDINNFDNDKIENYVFFYYLDYANALVYEENGEITYNVSKKEVDALVLNTFGKKDFKVSSDNSKSTGIRKIDDNTYQIYTFATAGYITLFKFKNVTEDDNSAKVEYTIYANPSAGEGEGIIGTATFYLTRNDDGNLIINKIKFNKIN